MTNYPYILFNKSPEQLRRLGARGGRAYGCNQRARRARMPKLPDAVVLRAAPRESTAEAIAVLDAQFPWLRGAEKRRSWSQPSRPLTPVRTEGKEDFLGLPQRAELQRLLTA